jgi:hypothetical protein
VWVWVRELGCVYVWPEQKERGYVCVPKRMRQDVGIMSVVCVVSVLCVVSDLQHCPLPSLSDVNSPHSASLSHRRTLSHSHSFSPQLSFLRHISPSHL